MCYFTPLLDSSCVVFVVAAAAAKAEKTERIRVDDVEEKINACLSDVHGDDASEVIDVIRKAITNDVDETGYAVVCYSALELTSADVTVMFLTPFFSIRRTAILLYHII